jgi:hypothetical protein
MEQLKPLVTLSVMIPDKFVPRRATVTNANHSFQQWDILVTVLRPFRIDIDQSREDEIYETGRQTWACGLPRDGTGAAMQVTNTAK